MCICAYLQSNITKTYFKYSFCQIHLISQADEAYLICQWDFKCLKSLHLACLCSKSEHYWTHVCCDPQFRHTDLNFFLHSVAKTSFSSLTSVNEIRFPKWPHFIKKPTILMIISQTTILLCATAFFILIFILSYQRTPARTDQVVMGCLVSTNNL